MKRFQETPRISRATSDDLNSLPETPPVPRVDSLTPTIQSELSEVSKR